MCQFFGEDEENVDEEIEEQLTLPSGHHESFKRKVFILTDFRMLAKDGNVSQATARRGRYYLFFFFCTN
jgi:hypothetical protein